jgi:predicted P-loop ATPase
MPNRTNQGIWKYENKDGYRLFYIMRHERLDDDGILEKSYSQWSWDTTQKQWVGKAYPAPRPLYKLCDIYSRPEDKIMLCEGEKAVDAAQLLVGDRGLVTTWPGGAKAIHKVDWTPLAKRTVTIWPDADEAGIKCAQAIAEKLQNLGSIVNIIDVSDITERGWDAADALREGWDYERLQDWATRRASPSKAIVTVNVNNGERGANPAQIERWTANGIMLNSRGLPIQNIRNVALAYTMAQSVLPELWFDTYYQAMMVDWHDNEGPRKFEDRDDRAILSIYQSDDVGFHSLGADTCASGVRYYADNHRRHLVLEDIKKFRWDGTPRIDTYFIDVAGAEDTEYNRAVSKNFWLAMLARIVWPGCQCDSMFILEGRQGLGKTGLSKIIGGKGYVELGFNRLDKANMAVIMRGKWLCELGELTQFKRADISELKSWITCTHDEIRRAYDRETTNLPRGGILVGTTNQDRYLSDTTGGRRFFPIKLTNIKWELAKATREQCFAEAYARITKDETWWHFPEDASSHQEDRRIVDEWEPAIASFIEDKREEGVTVRDVAAILNTPIEKLDRTAQLRICDCLRALQWESKIKKLNKVVVRKWFPKEEK